MTDTRVVVAHDSLGVFVDFVEYDETDNIASYWSLLGTGGAECVRSFDDVDSARKFASQVFPPEDLECGRIHFIHVQPDGEGLTCSAARLAEAGVSDDLLGELKYAKHWTKEHGQC